MIFLNILSQLFYQLYPGVDPGLGEVVPAVPGYLIHIVVTSLVCTIYELKYS